MNNVFSNNLKKLRLQKNLTQEQVAEILGVSAQTISRWECNTTCPDIMLLPEIARLYCVTIDDLFKAESCAYENYAQRLASVYEATHNPEDFLKADIEFRKLKKTGVYNFEDYRIHGIIHSSMMCYCKRIAIEKFNYIISKFEKNKDVSPENITYWRTRYQILHYYVEIGKAKYICDNQEKRVKTFIENYMEWSALIYAYYYSGEFKRAYECFLKAKIRFPNEWVIYEIGSSVCRALKKFDEAISCCNKTLELNSEFLDAVYSKAFCFEEMGDYKRAYNTWIEIINSLKKDGYDVEAENEEKRAQACLERIK